MTDHKKIIDDIGKIMREANILGKDAQRFCELMAWLKGKYDEDIDGEKRKI